jgi:peptidoglycan/xylan/chitin deacetylase (PgdA/CDA1 family)
MKTSNSIGVAVKAGEEDAVKEFFELFKVPWEFYNKDRKYAVVISTCDDPGEIEAKLLLLYNSERSKFDLENKIDVCPLKKGRIALQYKESRLPIYGKGSIFGATSGAVIRLTEVSGQAMAIEITGNGKKIIRIGFDIFQEVRFLLTCGQPVEFSQIPTLDLHISALREWVLEAGMPLLEILPVPAGYNFACCLTHDIDFAGVRRHGLDRTIFGFIYRAIFCSLLNVFKGAVQWKKLRKNFNAVFTLPAVYMGLAEDFWMGFDRYVKIEKPFCSTFFIIPFKNYAGIARASKRHARRASRYDISDIKDEINSLMKHGCEIGVHGIDAWLCTNKASEEFKRVYDATGIPELGIRMHWLYFNDQSYNVLEKAGYLYDSSCGYNEAIGYKSGTMQVFRPLGLKKLLELPLHVQDTALFSSGRMGLSEERAWPLVDDLLKNAGQYGGALTINWHDRSLSPERLWGDFYLKIIESLKRSRPWVSTASRVVRWFDNRRSISFKEVVFLQDKIRLCIEGKHCDDLPDFVVRIHEPKTARSLDIHFADILKTEIIL